VSVYGTHLADTSAIFRIQRDPDVQERWSRHLSSGLVAVCPVVELEMLRAAGGQRSRTKAAMLLRRAYGWVPMPDDVFEQAEDLQNTLAAQSAHQGPSAVDLLVAVTAHSHGLKVLHYDRDYETIAKAAGIEIEWVAQPGSVS
jgi:predicted nucleic acid-binding protein